MGDNFQPPIGFAPPPDTPDIPVPNFTQVGTALGIGAQTSGFIGSIWSGLFDSILPIAAKVLGWFLSILLQIFAYVIRLASDTSEEASAGYGALVSATVKEVFGVDVPASSVSTRVGGPDRQAVATKLGTAILGAMFGTPTLDAGGGIAPTSAPAEEFLAVIMNMELNGWLESWFTDGISGHLLEKYGDLKDGIARSMGLGRMSRQAFAPPLKVLVHDPYLAKLESIYRSKPMDERTACHQFFRGQLTRDQLSTILGRQGYSEQYIDFKLNEERKYLSDGDVDYLLGRGSWGTEDAANYFMEQGWSDADAHTKVAMLTDRRLHKYRLESITAAQEAYVRGELAEDAWQTLVTGIGITAEEQNALIASSHIRRSLHVTHLTLGQIETGIRDGILNLDDLKTWATRNNMPPDEEAQLELMVLYTANKQTATAQAKAAAAAAKAKAAQDKIAAATAKATAARALAADKGVTVAQAETLVKDGLWTFDHLTAFLTAKGYGGDAIAAIVALLHNTMGTTAAAAGSATAVRNAAAARGLNLAQMEKAVIENIITIDQLQAYLTSHGFSQADADIILQLTRNAAADAAVKAAAKASASAAAGKRQLSLPNLERAVRLGLTSADTYTQALTNAGFDPMSRTLLLGILNDQIAADKITAVKRAAANVEGNAAGLSLQQLENAVIAGLSPMSDYTAALAKIGYSADDRSTLAALLQLKVDQHSRAIALHTDAEGKAEQRGFSLAKEEAAVVAGVRTMDDYDAFLTTLGYDQADRDTLEAVLTQKIQAKASKAAGTPAQPAPPPTAPAGGG
jgi:hypothetical protein